MNNNRNTNKINSRSNTNRHFSKYITAATLSILLFTNSIAFSEYQVFEKIVDTTQISTGVIQKDIKLFTDAGWIEGHAIIADLKDANTDIELLKPASNLSSSETLNDMITNENLLQNKIDPNREILAAINGDFFDRRAKTALGPIIDDGNFLSSKYNDNTLSTFEILKDNTGTINTFINPKVEFLNNSRSASPLTVDYFNKPYLKGDAATLLTTTYSTHTLGYDGKNDILEIIVIDDVITERRYNKPAIAIPKNGYVISAYNQKMVDLVIEYLVGDSVSIKRNSTVNDNIHIAFGGGSTLISDGKIPDKFSAPINGIHPRSAIGITQDGTKIIMLSINGRSKSYRGVSETELAGILLDLGAYNAINLDGGGSTELISTKLGSDQTHITSYLSDGGERSIFNGIGILDTSTKSANVGMFEIITPVNKLFVGTSIDLTTLIYDVNYNTIPVDSEQIQWSVSGIKGHFKNNQFFADSPGSGKLYAIYGSNITTIDVHAYDQVQRMIVSPSKINTKSNKPIDFNVYGYTPEGFKLKLDSQYLNWHMPQSIGHMDQGRLVLANKSNVSPDTPSMETASGIPATQTPAAPNSQESKAVDDLYASVSYGRITKYLPLSVGVSNRLLEDFETYETKKALLNHYEFTKYPEEVLGSIDLSKSNQGQSLKLEYDFTTTDATRAAYIEFGDKFILTDETNSINLDIYGENGNGHWLRAILLDAEGDKNTIELSKDTSWQGWQTFTINIPPNLSRPVKLDRLYLVEPDSEKKDQGSILVDNIIISEGSRYTKTPQNLEFLPSPELNGLQPLEGADNLFFKTSNNNLILAKVDGSNKSQIGITQAITEGDQAILLQLDNTSSSIAHNDSNNWQTFNTAIQLSQTSEKPLLVFFEDRYSFRDYREENLFLDKLTGLAQGQKVYLVFNNEPLSAMKKYNGLHLIKLDKDHKDSLFIQVINQTIQFDYITDSELYQLLQE